MTAGLYSELCEHGDVVNICPPCQNAAATPPPYERPVRHPIAYCKGCHAPIVWTVTTNGRRMPVDADPDPDGNVVIRPVDGQLHAIVYRKAYRGAGEPGETLHTSHFATCPHRREFKT